MKRLVLLFLLFSNSTIFGHQYGTTELEYWESASHHFLEQSDWRKAFHCAFNALHETEDGSRDQLRIYTKIAHLYFYFEKSYGDAEGYYRKALQIDPYSLPALIGTGDVYFARGEYVGALEYYQRAALKHPEKHHPYASIAAAFYEKAEVEKAMHYYELALEKNSKDPVSLNNLGNLYFDKLRLKEAKGYYLEALKVNPDFVTAHNNIGLIYLHEKDYNEALRHFKRALKLTSNDSVIYSNLANVYFELRQVERAKHYLQRALYFDKNAVYHNNLAVMEKFTDEELNAGVHYSLALNKRYDYSNARKHSGFFKTRSVAVQHALSNKVPKDYTFRYTDRKGGFQRRVRSHNVESWRNRFSVSSP